MRYVMWEEAGHNESAYSCTETMSILGGLFFFLSDYYFIFPFRCKERGRREAGGVIFGPGFLSCSNCSGLCAWSLSVRELEILKTTCLL